MTIVALLLTLALPRYFGNVDRTKDSVLRENLATLRESLDKFYADTGVYPSRLEDLVAHRYLRKIPVDPITDSNTTWIVVPPKELEQGGVYDVRSGAPGKSRGGTPYRDW